MQCPIDRETLVIAERSGVEIDYCPKCRGVWLDRGELDKLVERAGSFSPTPARTGASSSEHATHRSASPKRKHKSFLSNLFDF
jgi:Zn-finger nucleic acid-binding protein